MIDSRYDSLHGDEPWSQAEAKRIADEYEAEHAEDYKHNNEDE